MEAIELTPLEVERLKRLRAEMELAQLRSDLARQCFEQALADACRERGVQGQASLDLDKGTITPVGRLA